MTYRKSCRHAYIHIVNKNKFLKREQSRLIEEVTAYNWEKLIISSSNTNDKHNDTYLSIFE